MKFQSSPLQLGVPFHFVGGFGWGFALKYRNAMLEDFHGAQVCHNHDVMEGVVGIVILFSGLWESGSLRHICRRIQVECAKRCLGVAVCHVVLVQESDGSIWASAHVHDDVPVGWRNLMFFVGLH